LLQVVKGASDARFDHVGSQMVAACDSGNVIKRYHICGAGTDPPIIADEGSGTATKRWPAGGETGSR
jgi:hypothetical protein